MHMAGPDAGVYRNEKGPVHRQQHLRESTAGIYQTRKPQSHDDGMMACAAAMHTIVVL